MDCLHRSNDEGNPNAGASCNTGLNGVCEAGIEACNGGQLTCEFQITPGTNTEICDGLDNDCNGIADDVFEIIYDANGDAVRDEDGHVRTNGIGDECTVGSGACSRSGSFACTIGVGMTCDAVAGVPSDELCNGEDDDCDGNIDIAVAIIIFAIAKLVARHACNCVTRHPNAYGTSK